MSSRFHQNFEYPLGDPRSSEDVQGRGTGRSPGAAVKQTYPAFISNRVRERLPTLTQLEMSKLVRVAAARLLYTGARRTSATLLLTRMSARESLYTGVRSILAIPVTFSLASTAPRELLYTGARNTLSTSSRDRARTDDTQRVIIHRRARHLGHS